MGKELSHEDRLDAEARSTIKRLLTEIEEASEKEPLIALHPYEFNDRRKRVMRAVWNLLKVAKQMPLPDAEITTVFECPHCRGHIEIKEKLG
jgi:hypothetical protein